jgi:hypothetical protein
VASRNSGIGVAIKWGPIPILNHETKPDIITLVKYGKISIAPICQRMSPQDAWFDNPIS